LEPNSVELGDLLANLGADLIQIGEFAKSETVLRECVVNQIKIAPDAWNTFNAQSMLGEALFVQEKYDEALPLLTVGYEGMKQRAASIPKKLRSERLVRAVKRLVQLAEDQQMRADIQKWKEELDELGKKRVGQ